MARSDKNPSWDFSVFVVLGEGLAAGVGHFALTSEVQESSFPKLVARQLKASFSQPSIEPPGIGHVPGLRQLPVIVPDLLQTTVRAELPPSAADLGNLSVPGTTLRDALDRRPELPLVRRDDPFQTTVNLVLGLPDLVSDDGEAASQAEYARRREATVALVVLGYHEAVTAALAGDADRLPAVEGFRRDLERLLDGLAGEVVIATVPDPLDTAHFADLDAAARLLRTTPAFLKRHFDLADDDLLSLEALVDAGYQLLAHDVNGELPAGGRLGAEQASRLRAGVDALNREISYVAGEAGARVWDLHAFLRAFARDGADVGEHHLDAGLLGGFYLLNGFYPGPTGHALLANDLLACLDDVVAEGTEPVDVEAVAADDPNLLARRPEGPSFEDEFLHPWGPDLLPPPPEIDPSQLEIFPIQTIYPGTPFDPMGAKQEAGCEPLVGMPAGGVPWRELETPLELPEGMEQTLSINPEGSYFGDALRVVDAPEEEPFLEGVPPFGASGKTFFGGLLMTDSRLHGQVHLRFVETDEDHVVRFEISHPDGGLMGENGTLAAPQLFRLPSYLNMVSDVPGLVSSGQLDLKSGLVTDLHYHVLFLNTAILSLFAANPHLPKMPMSFPGPPNAGSTSARFEQRADGLLDITLGANMFLPLGHEHGGEPVRLPLPFGSPMLECASIVARGLSLHPHIHFTTRERLLDDDGYGREGGEPRLEENRVYELVTFDRNSNFGDVFGLDIEELGGAGTGRSHLMGRLRLQTGPRFGDLLPLAASFLPPGGQLDDSPKHLPYLPPGTSRGLIGFNEELKFPKTTYPQKGLASADDPNNRALGAVDLRTGRLVGDMLHRAFVVQELFVHLIRLEPCTPADSFNYQGAACVENGAGGELIYRFDGEVYLPYPKGFRFPAADGRDAYLVVGPSRLDPFLRLRAHSGLEAPRGVLEGGRTLESSIGQSFTYRYALSPDRPASFEYTNHTEGGTFVLTALSWVCFSRSRAAAADGTAPDTVTFTGFGTWSEDAEGGLHQVAAQVCSGPETYVGIQVDGGLTSNVNTKPPRMEDSLP